MGLEPSLDRWGEFASLCRRRTNISRSTSHLEDSESGLMRSKWTGDSERKYFKLAVFPGVFQENDWYS